MHADEAILADKVGTLLATGFYPYDPRQYHGPVLGYLAWIPARLSGRMTYQTLTEATLRIAPAVAGTLLALSPLLLAPVIGIRAAAWASALVAVSPVMVYYSRYFIPEMPLALWNALLIAAMTRQGARSWALAGAAAALMLATKETAVLALASAAIAWVVAFRPRRIEYRAALAFLAALAAGISVLLEPPWKWGILAEAARAYVERGTGPGLHNYPWYTYLKWLAGWGYFITEAPILLLALAGLAVARKTAQPVARFLGWYAVALAVFYSAIPYKTPWCVVSLMYALALLASVAIDAFQKRRAAVTQILVAAAVVFLCVEAWMASVQYATDTRNPWVYAQTGRDVFMMRDRIGEFARVAPERNRLAVDIYSSENLWPLPWYLRQLPNVRWYRQVAIRGRAAKIVLVSPAMEPDLTRKLYEGPPPGERELYMNLFPGYTELRPSVEVRGYVAKSLWDLSESERKP